MTLTKIFLSLLMGLLVTEVALAQNYDFGEVSLLEVGSKEDSDFPDANAVVLYRGVTSYIGNYVEVHERIKIFNEEGYEHATIRIPYTDVSKVKGATYNLVNGKVVETELDKSLVFTDELIKGVEFKKFTFPNLKPGSVIELSYKSYDGTTSNIDLQYDIPIKKINVKVTNRSQIGFEILQNPRAFLDASRIEQGNSTLFSAKNVPALEAEDFVYDMDMYRSYLKINLTAVTTSFQIGNWKSLSGAIMGDDNFSRNIKAKSAFKDQLTQILGGEKDQLKKSKLIYDHIKNEISWNDVYDFIPNQSVKDTYKKKEGSLADMNALLISMLRTAGIKANPVLVSTKDNGIPLTASANSFNGMIVGVNIGDSIRLFDVASTMSTFNLLDEAFLNWEGMYMDQDAKEYSWVGLTNTGKSQKSVIVDSSIDEDLMILGNVKERHAGYYSVNMNYELKDVGENDLENILSYDYNGLELTGITTNMDKEEITDISYEFELDNVIDEIGDKLYLSPLLFLGMTENPFQKDGRKYPIDFGFAFKDQIMLSIKVPEGYKIESLPESSIIGLPEDIGRFIFRSNSNGQNVQISSVFEMNKPLLPHDQFQVLKEFFKMRMEKESEKIVLSKI